MQKNLSRNHTVSESGARPARKPSIDVARLATLCGVVALLGISIWNWRSLSQIQTGLDSRLSQIESRLGQVSGKVETVAAQLQPPRRGPDPNRVYTINTVGAPVEGPVAAPITIAEFSDFQ
jgi:hypothetical protein